MSNGLDKIKLGNFYLVDMDGNHILEMDSNFSKDGFYANPDDPSSYVSEENAEIQAFLNGYGLKTLNGSTIKDAVDYMAVFDREVKKIGAAQSCEEIDPVVGNIVIKALDAGLLQSYHRAEGNTEIGLLTAIAGTSPNNYQIPLCTGHKMAASDELEKMDKMFRVAYDSATLKGVDISASLDEARRKAYKSAMREMNTNIKQDFAKRSDSIVYYSNDLYRTFLRLLQAKNIKETETLFNQEFIDKVKAAANNVRLEGYRIWINMCLEKANGRIESGGSSWLYLMNTELDKAYDPMTESGLENEFAAKIDQTRQAGYDKMIDQHMDDSDSRIKTADLEKNWLYSANVSLDKAVELAEATIDAGDKKADVYPPARRTAILAGIAEKRKAAYRKMIELLIKNAGSYIKDGVYDRNNLYQMDQSLNKALSTSTEGKVIDEFKGKISETRQAGYKNAVDTLTGDVTKSINEKKINNRNSIYQAEQALNNAVELAKTTIDHEDLGGPVFDKGKQEKIIDGIEAVRRNAFRALTRVIIDSAKTQIGPDMTSNALYQMNQQLTSATETADAGKVVDDFAKEISDVRKSGYRQMINDRKSAALAIIKEKSNGWVYSVRQKINAARDNYINASVNNKPVFSDDEINQLTAEIRDIERQLPTE